MSVCMGVVQQECNEIGSPQLHQVPDVWRDGATEAIGRKIQLAACASDTAVASNMPSS
jgi:hypothetical protein